ncbi:MAG: hypothetical protein WC495_05615 [Patescibacteria group bacterium]
MTELMWKNEEDRLSIIKNGMLNNLFYTDNSARLWRNKYLPWMISRIEELERERKKLILEIAGSSNQILANAMKSKSEPHCPNHDFFIKQLAQCPDCGEYYNHDLAAQSAIYNHKCKKHHDKN